MMRLPMSRVTRHIGGVWNRGGAYKHRGRPPEGVPEGTKRKMGSKFGNDRKFSIARMLFIYEINHHLEMRKTRPPSTAMAIGVVLWTIGAMALILAGWMPARGGGATGAALTKGYKTTIGALTGWTNTTATFSKVEENLKTMELSFSNDWHNHSWDKYDGRLTSNMTIQVWSAMDEDGGSGGLPPDKGKGKKAMTAEELEESRRQDEEESRREAERIEADRIKRETDEYVRNHEQEVMAMPEAERRAYLRGMEMQASQDERMAAAIARQQEREAEEEASRSRARNLVREQELAQAMSMKTIRQQAEERAASSGKIEDLEKVFELEKQAVEYKTTHLREISRIDQTLSTYDAEQATLLKRMEEIRRAKEQLAELRGQRVRALMDGRPLENSAQDPIAGPEPMDVDPATLKRARESTSPRGITQQKKARTDESSESNTDTGRSSYARVAGQQRQETRTPASRQAGPSRHRDVGPRAEEGRRRDAPPSGPRRDRPGHRPAPYSEPPPTGLADIESLAPQQEVYQQRPSGGTMQRPNKKKNKVSTKSMEDTQDNPRTLPYPDWADFKYHTTPRGDGLIPTDAFFDFSDPSRVQETLDEMWDFNGGPCPTYRDVEDEILGTTPAVFTDTYWENLQSSWDLPRTPLEMSLEEQQAANMEDYLRGFGENSEPEDDEPRRRSKGQRKAARTGKLHSAGFIISDDVSVTVPRPSGRIEILPIPDDADERTSREIRSRNDHIERWIKHEHWCLAKAWRSNPGIRPGPLSDYIITPSNVIPGPNARTGWRRDNRRLGFISRYVVVDNSGEAMIGRSVQLLADYYAGHNNADVHYNLTRGDSWPRYGFPDTPAEWDRAISSLEFAPVSYERTELAILMMTFRRVASSTVARMRDRTMAYALATEPARWERVLDRYGTATSFRNWDKFVDAKLPPTEAQSDSLWDFHNTAIAVGFPTAQRAVPGLVMDIGMRVYAGALLPAFISLATSPRGDDTANTARARRAYQLVFGTIMAVPRRASRLIEANNALFGPTSPGWIGPAAAVRGLHSFPWGDMHRLDELLVVRHLLNCGISIREIESFYVYGVNWLHDSLGRSMTSNRPEDRDTLLEVERDRLEALRGLGGTEFPPPLPNNDFWIVPSIEQVLDTMYWSTVEIAGYSQGTLGAFHGALGAPSVPRAGMDRFFCETFTHQSSLGYWWPYGASAVRNIADRAHVGEPEDPPVIHSIVHHSDGCMTVDEVSVVLSREPYPYGSTVWPIVAPPAPAPPSNPITGGAASSSSSGTQAHPPQDAPSEDVDMGDSRLPAGSSEPAYPLDPPPTSEDVQMKEVELTTAAAAVPLPDSDDEDHEPDSGGDAAK